MRKTAIVALVLISLLTSCSPSKGSLPPVNDLVSITAEILPTATENSTPKPPAARMASRTPAPTALPWAFQSLPSPDGEWVANAYFENDHASGKQTIEIQNKVGKLAWQIPFQGEEPTGYPRPLLVILGWSKDSTQLFFHYVWSPDGGDRAFWWSGYDLQKVDVRTGELKSVLPGSGMMSFEISPDGSQIAYTRSQDNPAVIYVRDLSSGSEKKAYVLFGSKNYAIVGDIRWSPTGEELIFQTEDTDHIVQTILLRPALMKQRLIREYSLFFQALDGWTKDGQVQFSLISADGMRIERVIQIDLATGQTLEIGTPTPRP